MAQDDLIREAIRELRAALRNPYLIATVVGVYPKDATTARVSVNGMIRETLVDPEIPLVPGDQILVQRADDGTERYVMQFFLRSTNPANWYNLQEGELPDISQSHGPVPGSRRPFGAFGKDILWLAGEGVDQLQGGASVTQGPYIYPKPVEEMRSTISGEGAWKNIGLREWFKQVVVGDVINPGSYGPFIDTGDRLRIVRELGLAEDIIEWGDVPHCITSARTLVDSVGGINGAILANNVIYLETSVGFGVVSGHCNPSASKQTAFDLNFGLPGGSDDFAIEFILDSVDGDGDLVTMYHGSPTGAKHLIVRVRNGLLQVGVSSSSVFGVSDPSQYISFGGVPTGLVHIRHTLQDNGDSRITVNGTVQNYGWTLFGGQSTSLLYTEVGDLRATFADHINFYRDGSRSNTWMFPRPGSDSRVRMAGLQGEVGWIRPHPEIPKFPFPPGFWICIFGDEVSGNAQWMRCAGSALVMSETGEIIYDGGEDPNGLPHPIPTHGELRELEDDDHPQYLTDGRLTEFIQSGVITADDIPAGEENKYLSPDQVTDATTAKTETNVSTQFTGSESSYTGTIPSYKQGSLEVFLNGLLLRNGKDYTETPYGEEPKTGFEFNWYTPGIAGGKDVIIAKYRPVAV